MSVKADLPTNNIQLSIVGANYCGGLDIARCTRFDVLICRVPITGDAAAPRLNNGLEGVAGDAATALFALAVVLAPNVKAPFAVVGVAVGGAPNTLPVGIDTVGLANWNPEVALFVVLNLNGPLDVEAGAAGLELAALGALNVNGEPAPVPVALPVPNPVPNPLDVAVGAGATPNGLGLSASAAG